MEDKTLVCKDCGKEFIFTVGEQEFFKEKGFDNEPVRCPECRISYGLFYVLIIKSFKTDI